MPNYLSYSLATVNMSSEVLSLEKGNLRNVVSRLVSWIDIHGPTFVGVVLLQYFQREVMRREQMLDIYTKFLVGLAEHLEVQGRSHSFFFVLNVLSDEFAKVAR